MDNIEFFNRFTLALLEHLYSQFPTPTEIDTLTIASKAMPDNVDADCISNFLCSTDDAVIFLAEEGFLTCKGTYLEGGKFLQVRLTAKGLAALGSTPESLGSKEPLISRIRKALANGTKEATSETVRQLTQQAISAAILAVPAITSQLTR
ncbi:hypothetical protein [Pseudomonas sp. Marseille-QA0892]